MAEHQNLVKVVELKGILDGNFAHSFQQKISEYLEEADIILIDLKAATFMDSSGLGAMNLALRAVRTKGAKLYLCSIPETIQILFELTGMDRLFKIYENREAFEKDVASDML